MPVLATVQFWRSASSVYSYRQTEIRDKTQDMAEYKFTAYFENEVLRKRSYLKKEWCLRIIENPIRVEIQGDNRVRFWGRVKEFRHLVFRVVTLADRVTIHNAFPDRGFKK